MLALQAARSKKGMTQKELASAVGIAPSTISNYEAGEREPSLDILCAMADALDCSLDMLILGKEKDRPEWRSIEEIARAFNSLSDAHLEMLAQTALALLAERRFRVQQEKDQKETQ